MAIYNGKDLYTLAALGLADLLASAFGRCKARVDERFTLVNVALVAKRIGQLRENLAQHFLLGAGKVPDDCVQLHQGAALASTTIAIAGR